MYWDNHFEPFDGPLAVRVVRAGRQKRPGVIGDAAARSENVTEFIIP